MVDDDAAARWGIQARYQDALGAERAAPDHAVEAVISRLRRDDTGDGPWVGDEVAFVVAGEAELPSGMAGRTLVTEDGTDLGAVPSLPPDLPLGYHHLLDERTGSRTTLVVHPGACHRPDDLHGWGWALQLHSDRSAASWGIGDLADARTIGRWSQAHGGDPFLLLNPLHAPNLGDDPRPSPYFASSRCFHNPLALRVDEIPGAADHSGQLAALAAQAQALNAERLIDRRAVWRIKRDALALLFDGSGPPARARADAAMAADPCLAAFASFMAAVEVHGDTWTSWPLGLRHPEGDAWGPFRTARAERVAFHAWLQQVTAEQVSALADDVRIVHDLAVGTDRAGFDAWYWQDVFVLDGTRVGAPADQFNTLGQDWGLPPLDPWRLRAARYEPFVRMLRAAMAHGAGLRVDHVMGLFRLFWIPAGFEAADGVYVRQPADELLALVALESTRAEAFVVGEDLGTVEPGVREELARRRLLSYRVLELDDTPPEHYPVEALASVSTHDLATIAGFWTGSDLRDQERLGMAPPVDETWAARDGFGDRLGLPRDAPVHDVVVAAHRALARTPSRLHVAQLEDAGLVAERPNMPGTTDGWPNWSLALPRPIEEVLAGPTAAAIAHELASGGTDVTTGTSKD